jgi:hypothetical protein
LGFELAIEKLKSNKSPGNVQIPAELIKAAVWTIRCAKWKESIKVPIYRKGDKSDCNNYSGISLCQLRTKRFQHPAVKVTPYAGEIIVDYQGGFRRKR